MLKMGKFEYEPRDFDHIIEDESNELESQR